MELFRFDKDIITRHIEYELKTVDKFKEPLNYIIKNLVRLGHSLTIDSLDKKINLNKIKENEGKNYHWSVFNYKNVTLVVRRYGQHLTIFTKVIKEKVDYEKRPKVDYGAFTFNVDFEKFGKKHDEMMDKYYDKPFTEFSDIFKGLMRILIEKDAGVHWVWNSVSLPRPEQVKIELAFDNNSISSIDNFAFCMEEIDSVFLSLFAENTMLQRIKEIKSGKKLGDRYKAGEIRTEVKDDYYHAVGISLIDTMNKDKSEWADVYSLSRYYFKDIFKDKKIYLFEGEVYVEGDEFKVGEPVAYKNEEYGTTLFQKTFPKENFIPLKKY